jgi:beta-glucanase (GH16 family)
VWSSDGFKTKEFGFTSGIINTANSFRQKYGTIQAKVKLGNPGAKSAFWMITDKITPHVDICRTSNGKVLFDYFATAEKRVKSSLGAKYANDFYIYTLDWTPDKLVWKINNTEVMTQTSDVPQEPMYLSFSGGLDKPINSMTSMEIDWVRVYQPKK